MFGQVETYQQSTPYNCAAATLHAVLKHWGTDIDEAILARLIGIDPVEGASSSQVVNAAYKLGWEAQEVNFASLDELKKVVDRDVPVIVAVLSFTRPGGYHFVVVTEIDENGVVLMDPNVAGNWRTLTPLEMDCRWKRGRSGIVVAPRRQFSGAAVRPLYKRPWFWVGAVGVASATAGIGYWRTRR